jgi:hypothetical protein
MNNKEIKQQNNPEKQDIEPATNNLEGQSSAKEDIFKEKMDVAKKIILSSLGIESDISLDNFNEQLEKATKALPRYQQIERELQADKNEELPYELFKTLKTDSDKVKADESGPKDGGLITSMKQGNLECAGRTLIASTFLQEHNLDHVVVSAPGHAFLIVEQSPDNLAYFDANSNLFFTFPRQALEGYKGLGRTSECRLKEYTPRKTDFYDGISTVFSDFITMPASEGIGRQYLGNVAAALDGNNEFKTSGIVVDKEAAEAAHQIEEEIYGQNEVLENYYSKVEDLIKKQEIQTDDDKRVIGEIKKSYSEHDDFISFFAAALEGNLGARIPYIKNASKEQKIAFAEKAWSSLKDISNKENKEIGVNKHILNQKENGLRELFKNSKNPVEVILQEMDSDKIKEFVDESLLNTVKSKLNGLTFKDEDEFVSQILAIGEPIWEITQKGKPDLFKQPNREMFTAEDVRETVKNIQATKAQKIYVVGNVGSGKSTFARELAGQTNFKNIDLDHFFQIYRQEKNKEANLSELLDFVLAREEPPYIINHADLLNHNLSDKADMVILLNPKKEEQIKSRQIRQENKTDGEWQNVNVNDYDKISRDNLDNLAKAKGQVVYINDKSGTLIKSLEK